MRGCGSRHWWTEQEREVIRRDYDSTRKTTVRLAGVFGVTPEAIKKQADLLGVAKRRVGPTYRSWTPEEDETLSHLITRYRPSIVAKRMGRSVNAVVVRSKRLGLSRMARDGWFTKAEVCELFGVQHQWVQHRIDTGKLKGELNSPDLPSGKPGMNYWRISARSVKAFIKRHPEELNGRNVDLISIVFLLSGKL